jgi:YVTN family beta-propeller protein
MVNQAAVLICRFLAATLGVLTRQINIPCRCIPRFTAAVIVLVAVTACGGGGSTPPPPPPAMYSIGGIVSGLDAGQSVTLQLNGGNDQTVSTNVAFTFASKIASGSAYAVTVVGGPVGKACTVNGGAGTASANVTSVAVACVALVSIGGTVSGLEAGQYIKLQNNGAETITVSTNTSFTFSAKVASGGAYAVAVVEWPVYATCTVTGGSGIASADVTNVLVTCAMPPTFSVGGSVSGLVGQGLEISLQAVMPNYNCYPCRDVGTIETLPIGGNGALAFTAHPYSGSYRVVIQQQPQSPTQRCAVQNDIVTIRGADVTNVGIVCGEFAPVVHSSAQTISGLDIDAATGALVSATSDVTSGLAPHAVASTPDKAHLYVSNSGSNDVSVFDVDASSGALTAVPGSPFAAGTTPRGLAISTAYGISYYFEFLSFSHLYVANAGSNNLSAYQIDRLTGVPTPLSPATYATGSGPSAIVMLPTSPQVVYTANAGGSNDISAFLMEAGTGALTPVVGSPFPSGHSVSSLAFGATDKFLYAADANGNAAAIYGFSIDSSGSSTRGALATLPGSPYPLPSCTFIVTDQTGSFLYATTDAGLLGYSINATTGALTSLSGFPIAVGVNVRSLSIDPANQFLYVANGSAGTVTSYTLNAATGALTPMLGSPFAEGTSADYIATF